MNTFTFAQKMNLQPGDVVIVPKSNLKIVRHYMIFEGVNHFGQECYLENNNYYGVRRITGETFTQENPTYFEVRRFVGNENQRYWAIHRAQSLIGRSYNLLTFNCEHYANHVQYNKDISPQVAISSIAATVLLILCCI